VGPIRHGEPGRERKKGGRANMTSAGGGERLDNKSPPPLPPPPLAGDLKILNKAAPPPQWREFKSCQLKMDFSQKVLGRFLIQKYF
jgi:hypothetical protein